MYFRGSGYIFEKSWTKNRKSQEKLHNNLNIFKSHGRSKHPKRGFCIITEYKMTMYQSTSYPNLTYSCVYKATHSVLLTPTSLIYYHSHQPFLLKLHQYYSKSRLSQNKIQPCFDPWVLGEVLGGTRDWVKNRLPLHCWTRASRGARVCLHGDPTLPEKWLWVQPLGTSIFRETPQRREITVKRKVTLFSVSWLFVGKRKQQQGLNLRGILNISRKEACGI